MDLWEVVDKSKEAFFSNKDLKVKNGYQTCVKKTCTSLATTWQIINFCTSRVANDQQRCELCATSTRQFFFSNIFFVHCKFFMCKMQKANDLLNHVNKVKAVMDQLACLETSIRKNISSWPCSRACWYYYKKPCPFQPWYQWLAVLNNSLNDCDAYPTHLVWRGQHVSHY